jgi:hypothetical protein
LAQELQQSSVRSLTRHVQNGVIDSPKQLTFIPETGNIRPAGVVERRLIRSHASRSASKNAKKKFKDRGEEEDVDHLQLTRPRRDRRALKRDGNARHNVTGALVAGRVDPFDTLPIAPTPWRDELIDHCKSP